MNLTVTKARLKSAQTGHSLLAKKRDALTTRFRQILKKVDEVGLDAMPAIGGEERDARQGTEGGGQGAQGEKQDKGTDGAELGLATCHISHHPSSTTIHSYHR